MADIWSQQLNKEKLKKNLKYTHSLAFSHNYPNNENLFTHYKLQIFQLLEGVFTISSRVGRRDCGVSWCPPLLPLLPLPLPPLPFWGEFGTELFW